MQWREGDDWVAEVDLSPDMNAFKVYQPSVRRATCDYNLLPHVAPLACSCCCLYSQTVHAAHQCCLLQLLSFVLPVIPTLPAL